MKEELFNNKTMLDNQQTDEQIGFIDYMKDLGFIDKDRNVSELGAVYEENDFEIHVHHIYDNTENSVNQGEIYVDFGAEDYTDNHDDLYTSILMNCEFNSQYSL